MLQNLRFNICLQVEVYINGIPSKCSDDCSFEWSEEKTPVVTGISPSQGVLLNPKLSITKFLLPAWNSYLRVKKTHLPAKPADMRTVRDSACLNKKAESTFQYPICFQDLTAWGLFWPSLGLASAVKMLPLWWEKPGVLLNRLQVGIWTRRWRMLHSSFKYSPIIFLQFLDQVSGSLKWLPVQNLCTQPRHFV